MLESIAKDYYRVSNKPGNLVRYFFKALASPGFRAVTLYRVGHWFKVQRLHRLAGLIQRVMYRSCLCEISLGAEIEPGLLVTHTFGLVIGGGTRLGRNCDVRQNVTFGGNFNKQDENGRSHPWIGDNVSFGSGAVVIGPIRVGSNSIIGANTVVTRDVPENVIVFGVPGKVIKERWTEDSGRKL